jgi:hypothetical protein
MIRGAGAASVDRLLSSQAKNSIGGQYGRNPPNRIHDEEE